MHAQHERRATDQGGLNEKVIYYHWLSIISNGVYNATAATCAAKCFVEF
jgi:hypothetical protein